MKSIERRFRRISEENPDLSTHNCFAKSVWGQKFSKGMIARWFYKLVDKDDYAQEDKKKVLEHLFQLSHDTEKVLEDDRK